jgi:hypothetical protein
MVAAALRDEGSDREASGPGLAHPSALRARKEGTMRKIVLVLASLVAFGALTGTAMAGSPHFIANATSMQRSGDSLFGNFKLAGLGDEAQVHVVLSADAACINGGSNHPKAANKSSFSAAGDFPVQNGKAEGSLTLTATFSPSCSPPMTVQYSNVVLTATEPDGTTVIQRFPGTF